MRGSWWIFVEVTTTVTSMASLTRKPRSKYWFACFRDVNGKQRRRSTGQTDRKKALKVAEQFEQIGRRKLAPRTVRESLAELYREIYGETLPVATVRKFVADWLQTKEPEVSAGTLAFYKKEHRQVSRVFGHCCRPGSCLNNPDYRFGVQESRREKKFSGDYQRGSQGHKNDLQGSKA